MRRAVKHDARRAVVTTLSVAFFLPVRLAELAMMDWTRTATGANS